MNKTIFFAMTFLTGASLFAANIDDQVLEIMEEMGRVEQLIDGFDREVFL